MGIVKNERSDAPMRGSALALIVALCLVAANMRPAITAVGPLLDQIGTDTGLSVAALGMLASVPLLVWALVSPLALRLSRLFGMSRTILGGLLLLLLGTIIRSIAGPSAALWIGTVVIGVALAITNVLMPAVIKRDFPGRVPLMMGLYTALLGGIGAIGSGIAVPLSLLGDDSSGWRLSLLITGGALLPVAMLVWASATRGHHAKHLAARGATGSMRGIWADPVAWIVAGYMGFQAATFYMMLTWLASISVSVGKTEVAAGFDVMIYQLLTIAGPFIVPIVLRGRARRMVPSAIPVLGIVGVIGLILFPDAVTAWVLPIGLASGASLSMSLTLMAERARDHDASAALSGMAQSVGYIMAAIGPIVFGWLHTTTGGWTVSLIFLVVVLVGQGAFGVSAGRDRFVGDHLRQTSE